MSNVSMNPNIIDIGNLALSQTLITAIISNIIFFIVINIYLYLKDKYPHNKFVNSIDMGIEGLAEFIDNICHHLPRYYKLFIIFVFVYILWNNLLGVLGDMFALVIPAMHTYFRPVTTDVAFNAILAISGVILSNIYGLQHGGVRYLNKYFPLKGIGLVPQVNSIMTFVFRIFDVMLGLFIGLIELIGEFAKMISLSLRLFGNILAGMVLLSVSIAGASAIFHYPLGLPILVLAMETLVSIIQAFVFTLLLIVYFKMAGESH